MTDKKPFESKVIGLEDCRYFRIGKTEHIFGVSYEHVGNSNLTMVSYELVDEKENKIGTKPVIMKTRNRCEKNWLPVVETNAKDANEVKFIHSLSPTRMVELVGKNKGVKTIYEQTCNFDDERGSTIIDFNYQGMDGYLVLTHRVIFLSSRIYLSRFFFLNKQYQTLAASNYFYFLHVGIEYCLGCARNTKGEIVFGVSKTDKETFVVTVPELNIISMLYEVEKSQLKDEEAGYITE